MDSLYNELSKNYKRDSDAIHYDMFDCSSKQLFFRGTYGPLTNENGKLKTIEQIKSTRPKRIRDLCFEVPMGRLTLQQVSEVQEFMFSIDDANEIELQEIAKGTEILISQMSQTDDLFEHPLHELLGLDKQLRSIRGSLKVEVAKKVQLEEHIKKHCKLERIREYPGVYDDGI